MGEKPADWKDILTQPSQVPVNFALMARLQGDFSREQLDSALARAAVRYPAAGSALTSGMGGEPERIPVCELEGCRDQDWQPVACKELGTPLDMLYSPAVRLTLLRGADFTDLLFTFHHGAADGMSGLFFLRDTLRLLGDPLLHLDPQPVPPDMFDLIPPQVRRKPSIRLQNVLIRAALRGGRLLLHLKPRRKPAPPPDDPASPWSHFSLRTWELDETQTSRLAARCKSEGTSVHAAVCAAWLRASAESRADKGRWKRRVSSPVNLRPRLAQQDPEAFGLFMSIASTAANCAPERDFWQIAREIKSSLARSASGDDVFGYMLMMHAAFTSLPPADLGPMLAEFLDQPVNYDFSISNLGRVDLPAGLDGLHVRALYGPLVNSQPRERTVGVVTCNGCLRLSFVFCDLYLDPTAAQSLGDRAVEHLRKSI